MEKITIKTIFGDNLTVVKDDHIGIAVQKKGVYDKQMLDVMSSIMNRINARTTLDIGANIGNHSVVMAKNSKSLYSFEPTPFVYSILKENLENNNYKNATPYNLALSHKEGTCDFFVSKDGNLGVSSLVDDGVGEFDKIEVSTVIGDDFIKEKDIKNIDFIKLDVEGWETEVLLGLKNTFKNEQPILIMEWNSECQEGFDDNNLYDTLFEKYDFFHLTQVSNKKLYKKTLGGKLKQTVKRVLVGKKWCLSNFDKNKNYHNIILIPKRFKSILESSTYVESVD